MRDRSTTSRRLRRTAALTLATFVAALVLTGPTYALSQKGRTLKYGTCCGGSALDGVRAGIRIDTITPRTDECQIYSVLAYDATNHVQLETGAAKCNSWLIDSSSCGGDGQPFTFVETDFEGTFHCYRHSGFALGGSGQAFRVNREASGSNIFYAYISGVQLQSVGGIATAHTAVYGWGEANGQAGICPSAAYADFTNFQRLTIGQPWGDILSSTVFSGGDIDCYTVTGVTAGSFQVYR